MKTVHIGCTGKVRYTSEQSARRALDDVRRKHPEHEPSLRPFRCVHCGKWHLGRAWRMARFKARIQR